MELTHGRRLALGITVLALVDILWVTSSELTEVAVTAARDECVLDIIYKIRMLVRGLTARPFENDSNLFI